MTHLFDYAIRQITQTEFCNKYIETLYGFPKKSAFYFFYDVDEKKIPVYEEVFFEHTINELMDAPGCPMCYIYNTDSKEFAHFIQENLVTVVWEK